MTIGTWLTGVLSYKSTYVLTSIFIIWVSRKRLEDFDKNCCGSFSAQAGDTLIVTQHRTPSQTI